MRHLFNKLSAFLVMLMCVSATVQAQTEVMTMVVTKKNGDVTRFEAKNIAKVEWTNKIPAPTKGTSKAIINGNEVDVPWVQLWEDGPKFAEYNVGVTDGKAENYGGNYSWGSSIDKDPYLNYNEGTKNLTGSDDTATNLWGSNWRMPTQTELEALLANCDVEWTTVNGVNGNKYTGKNDYASNSVFLPAAGSRDATGGYDQGLRGDYWSSTTDTDYDSYLLSIFEDGQIVGKDFRFGGNSVRAVLK